MLKRLITTAAALAVLAGCSKPAEGDRAGRQAAAPAKGGSTVGAALGARRKEGLWKLAVSTSTGPGMSFNATMCVDKASTEKFDVKAPGMSDCQSSKLTPGAGGWTFNTVCKMQGRTVKTNGVITGDPSSNYRLEATTTMDPAPSGMERPATSVITAQWAGPCPAGMKPGEPKMSGFNFGG